jgi:hypothetical protein
MVYHLGMGLQHRLTNIRPPELLADCKACGPNTRVRRRMSDGKSVIRCARLGETRKASPEVRKRAKTRERITRYGITLEQYDHLIASQNGRCAICLQGPTGQRLSIDHCHASGKVRGLLCTNCNAALGMLGDDPARLARAMTYLQR